MFLKASYALARSRVASPRTGNYCPPLRDRFEPADEATQFLCTPESSTGFRFNEQSHSWVKTSFTTKEKYILRRFHDGEHPNFPYGPPKAWHWGFFQFGQKLELYTC